MKIEYAILPSRVKALFIDTIIIVALIFLASEILAQFEYVPNYVRIIIFILFFHLYDPLFVSIYGGTIGHSKMGITVRDAQNPKNKINFIRALFRFVFKVALGWISFLTISGNKKKQAIHDLIGNSIVIEDEK
ncbi:RDD family protein [Aureibaculum luteum]|uniref:RDD family protein n=1 Tax=Aureibaculum luteum TaxID=1548456 RepID=UPI000E4EC600|nr:RDD family protein [Aureibaculum luteum]